jgi:hypothetical protein
VVAGIVALIVLAAFDQEIKAGVWRVCFGLGIVVSAEYNCLKKRVRAGLHAQLPFSVFFFRIRMVNSTQYRKHAIKNNIPYMLALKKYWKPMLGTSLAWFWWVLVDNLEKALLILNPSYDFVTYPNNTVVQNIGYGVRSTPSGP